MKDYELGSVFLHDRHRLIEDPFMEEFRQFPVKETKSKGSKKFVEYRQNLLNKKFGFQSRRYVIQTEHGILMHPNTRKNLEKTINKRLVNTMPMWY